MNDAPQKTILIDLFLKFHSDIKVLKIFSLFAGLFLSAQTVYAYPEFIGYGYKSCLTCHWNGHGNGH
jgi:hypothetical protein